MKDPGFLDGHIDQFPLWALPRHVLERLVVIVITMGAKIFCTFSYSIPSGPIKSKRHIIFNIPRRYFYLRIYLSFIKSKN